MLMGEMKEELIARGCEMMAPWENSFWDDDAYGCTAGAADAAGAAVRIAKRLSAQIIAGGASGVSCCA